MAEVKDAVKVAVEQLDKKKDELENELLEMHDLKRALAELEARANELKEQIQVLAELPLPQDLLEFYIKTGGKVWVSKLRGHREGAAFEIRHGSYILTWSAAAGMNSLRDVLTEGAYRFILLMVPQDMPEADERTGRWKDDYGDEFDRPRQ